MCDVMWRVRWCLSRNVSWQILHFSLSSRFFFTGSNSRLWWDLMWYTRSLVMRKEALHLAHQFWDNAVALTGELTTTGDVFCKILSTIGFALFMYGMPALSRSDIKYCFHGSDAKLILALTALFWETCCDNGMCGSWPELFWQTLDITDVMGVVWTPGKLKPYKHRLTAEEVSLTLKRLPEKLDRVDGDVQKLLFSVSNFRNALASEYVFITVSLESLRSLIDGSLCVFWTLLKSLFNIALMFSEDITFISNFKPFAISFNFDFNDSNSFLILFSKSECADSSHLKRMWAINGNSCWKTSPHLLQTNCSLSVKYRDNSSKALVSCFLKTHSCKLFCLY